MNTLEQSFLQLETEEKLSVPKWSKFLSVIYYTEAVLLFLISFLLFIVKRTYGVDSYMVSGSYNGTTQLTFFIVVNLGALALAAMAYNLFKFSGENKEEQSVYLRTFLKINGVFSILLFCAGGAVIFYFLFGRI